MAASKYTSSISKHLKHQQQAPDPQGSRPLLSDPPLRLCLLLEVAQLGCLPGPEAAEVARSPGRNEMLSGRSFCVDPGVGRHLHVKVRMCAIRFILFVRTPRNTAKKKRKVGKKEQNRTTFSERYKELKNNQQINVQTTTCLDPRSFVVDP